MATIRAYTTIEQSRKLAEILPLESADMCCFQNQNGDINYYGFPFLQGNKDCNPIPCWSLAALLDVLTKHKICHYDDRYYCQYISEGDEFPIYSTAAYDNPIDACVAMIEKLNELNLL